MLQSKTDKYENISVSRKRMPIAKGCSNAYLEQQSQYYYCKQNLLCEKNGYPIILSLINLPTKWIK